MAKYDSQAEGLAAANIDGARRHLFLCLGPDCAPMDEGEKTWEHLKQQCRKLDLPVMRTKAGCFRICVGGPWLLVYPEGVWYGAVTPQRLDRILREHVLEGRPVAEWVVKTHPLGDPSEAVDGKP
jgi:(2Fe-2S) ferredoxin